MRYLILFAAFVAVLGCKNVAAEPLSYPPTPVGQLDRIDAEQEAAYAPKRAPTYVYPATEVRDLRIMQHNMDDLSLVSAEDILAFARRADEKPLGYADVVRDPEKTIGRTWRVAGRVVQFGRTSANGRTLTIGLLEVKPGQPLWFFERSNTAVRIGQMVEALGYASGTFSSSAKYPPGPSIAAYALVAAGSIEKVRALRMKAQR